MRVAATSDLHGALPDIPECDLLLLAGDICPDFGGHYVSTMQSDWLKEQFGSWLEQIPAKNVVGIAGNHDFVFERRSLIPNGLRWTYLQDTSVQVEHLLIHGTPWVPNLPFWAFFKTSVGLERTYEQTPLCDILLTHGPPFGYLDFCGQHVGSIACYDTIKRVKPTYSICGHVHEGFGRCELPDTTLLNVSLKDEYYQIVNPVVEFDL